MTLENKSFIRETLSQLDELSPETYWSAADKRRQQAVGLWKLDKDMGNRLPDKDQINAAEVVAAIKSNKLAAKGYATARARNAQDEQNRLQKGGRTPAQLAAIAADTDRARRARKVDTDRAMRAHDEQNRLNKAGLNPAWRAVTGAEDRARRDQDEQNYRLQQLGLRPPPPRESKAGSEPRRQDESKVFRIYRNSDQSATVVMESGVAVWLAPKSVNKVLSESGNINRTKLQRLLESGRVPRTIFNNENYYLAGQMCLAKDLVIFGSKVKTGRILTVYGVDTATHEKLSKMADKVKKTKQGQYEKPFSGLGDETKYTFYHKPDTETI
jgi:hypothetical protein